LHISEAAATQKALFIRKRTHNTYTHAGEKQRPLPRCGVGVVLNGHCTCSSNRRPPPRLHFEINRARQRDLLRRVNHFCSCCCALLLPAVFMRGETWRRRGIILIERCRIVLLLPGRADKVLREQEREGATPPPRVQMAGHYSALPLARK
jgi:hypothetical protein